MQVTLDQEVISEIRKTTQLMLEASANINNAIRDIERKHPYAGDATLVSALAEIKCASGDLSAQWGSFTMQLAMSDLSHLLYDEV